MTGVRANVTPVSFFVLLLHSWGDTKPQVLINDPGQNQQHLIPKQKLLSNEQIAEAIKKSRSIEKYASDSPNNLWINQILNTLENHLGKTEGSQENASQDKETGELIGDFPESVDLDKAHEKHMTSSETSKANASVIESILQTLKKISGNAMDKKTPSTTADSHRNSPTTSLLTVLKNIVITCLTVTGLLFVLVLLLYIFASLCMKSRRREPPVNNTYNIYITEEMKKNSACFKEIFSEKTREDNARLRSDTPNLQYVQSQGTGIYEPESKGKLFTQNSNYNNRSIFPGDVMEGQIMPLTGLLVPCYGNKSRTCKDFGSSSELSDSDASQTLSLPKPNSYQWYDIPGPRLNKEYTEKKDPNKVSESHKEPDTLRHSQHKLYSPDGRHQYNASHDSLNYAEETQSDTYPSSATPENSELVGNPRGRGQHY
ncbi:uncharacterized protein LOC118845825 [Trichosurus vulpecula]|uniref:uncharacterized protein LOC118845825 n=1 Tax=Trichosurus vulpecula TaxID=9337 RepID=UPI00186AE0DE|nr:uncharacterized protein LOC118845825 [Trichosurus vulpecula]